MANSTNLMNVSKSTVSEFLEDLTAKLSLVTGLVNMDDIGLSLEEVRKPMLCIGPPGCGKTCGIISVIEKLNSMLPAEKQMGFKKILLGQTVVGSMQGIPVVMPDNSVVRVQVPDLPDPEKDPEYGVLFLDEITTADEAQIQPALGLADDSRTIGTYTLPENWVVVAAGNGPDCTNFVRLDDMTISRFSVYDIAYNFSTDWRPYAINHNVEGDIIAFLNFAPTTCMRVESTEFDENGKLFPSPRTWERLSQEIKIRKAVSKPVPVEMMGRFASRIIGTNAGREFEAFMQCIENITVNPQDIVDGKAPDPEKDMKKEVFFSLLQGCTEICKKYCEAEDDGSGDFSEKCYTACANTLNYFLKLQDVNLDSVVTAVIQFKNDNDMLASIVKSVEFGEFCPDLNDFFAAYGTMIVESQMALSMGI